MRMRDLSFVFRAEGLTVRFLGRVRVCVGAW